VEGRDVSSQQDDDAASGGEFLPPLAKEDETPLQKLDALQHFTMPPPRFSEASLVKRLEELGIGRPSTYATILQVLQDRGYVRLEKKFFVPEIRGRLVVAFLMNFFSKYLEYGFTADMEQSLDDISNGAKTKKEILENFWRNFSDNIAQTKDIKISDVINGLNASLESFLFRPNGDGEVSRVCPECKIGELSLKIGRFGSFIGCSRYPDCNYIRKLDASASTDETLLASTSDYPKSLGLDPVDNVEIFIKKGPYGLYLEKAAKRLVQEENGDAPAKKTTRKTKLTTAEHDGASSGKGAKAPSKKKSKDEKPIRSSIPKFIDPGNLDLDMASRLLQMPRALGLYEGDEIKVGIGRFGPFVLFREKYISIKKPEMVLTMNLEDAIEMIKAKEARGNSSGRPRYKRAGTHQSRQSS
jgi:DNA topoisomerase-1